MCLLVADCFLHNGSRHCIAGDYLVVVSYVLGSYWSDGPCTIFHQESAYPGSQTAYPSFPQA